MQDLNDLAYFAYVVEHGGFIRAANVLSVPKSSLSKRVARLEQRLGVILIDRSTRRFRVTDVGKDVYQRCRDMLDNVAAAEAIVAETQSTPSGLLRVSCPPGLCEKGLATVLPSLMQMLPHVRIEVLVTNDRVDLIDQRIDIAFRVRQKLDTDANLKMRTLGQSRQVLVASAGFLAGVGEVANVGDLEYLPTLSMNQNSVRDIWELIGPDDQRRTIKHVPKLACNDFHVLRGAALAGIGVALLPSHICAEDIEKGLLRPVLPAWHSVGGIIHIVFKATKGIPPAARLFIDYIAREMPGVLSILSKDDMLSSAADAAPPLAEAAE